ncbi:hypothetical protein GCM10027037_06860 [Mucilaginibacter koreensis]
MRIALLFLLISSSFAVKAQSKKFIPGHFEDVKGNKMTGLIQSAPSGKGPVKGQAFIVFKEDDKANKIELAASDLRYFVAGRDSFVVAPAPMNANWSKNELDFIQVLADEPLKIYVLRGTGGGGFGISPGISAGIGGGSFGGYGGGGVGISFGGGQGGRSKTTYYFGASPSELTQITNDNFIDLMSDIMADEPQVVQQIQAGKYSLNKTEALIANYYYVKNQQKAGK